MKKDKFESVKCYTENKAHV